MPTVPRYQQQVQERQTPDVRLPDSAPAGAFGVGAQGQASRNATRNLISTADKLYEQERKKADDLAFMKADYKASIIQTDIERAVKGRRGEDALTASKDAQEEWDKKTAELLDTANGVNQRGRIQRSLLQRKASIYKTAESHQQNEILNYTKEQATAYVEAERNSAIENYDDPNAVGLSIERQKAALTKILDNVGISTNTPAGKKVLEEAISNTHVGIINRMLSDEKDVDAKGYFDAIKDEIAPGAYEKVQKVLEEGSLRGESQREMTRIVGSSKSKNEALDKVYAITDPKVKDETRKRVKEYYSLREDARKDEQGKMFQKYAKVLEENPTIDAIPPEDWMEFDEAHRKNLRAKVSDLKKGRKTETNMADYFELSQMAYKNPKKFKSLTYADLAKRQLSDTHMTKFVDMINNHKKGNTELFDGFQSDTAVFNDMLAKNGIDPSPSAPASKSKIAAIRARVDKRAEEFHERTGNKPTNDELRQLIVPEVQKVTVEDAGFLLFDKEKRTGELTEDDKRNVIVPELEKIEIINSYKRNGLPEPTAQQIREAYINVILGSN